MMVPYQYSEHPLDCTDYMTMIKCQSHYEDTPKY